MEHRICVALVWNLDITSLSLLFLFGALTCQLSLTRRLCTRPAEARGTSPQQSSTEMLLKFLASGELASAQQLAAARSRDH